jgi:hypothetical protein
MAKASGLGDFCYVDGFDLSGDIGSLSKISGGNSPLVVTGINKSAYERIGGKRDGEIDFTAFHNTAAGQEHPVLSALPTTDRQVSYFHGAAIGAEAASCVAKQINYDPTRGDDGSLTFTVQALANANGLEWGLQLTPGIRTDATATNGTSLDQTTVSTVLGWQAYLHVFAMTGTSVTCTIQDSADNATFATLTGAGFTAATVPGAQRLQGASGATVRRYVRVATTGTFTNAQFAVVFIRNLTAVSF